MTASIDSNVIVALWWKSDSLSRAAANALDQAKMLQWFAAILY